MNERGGGDGNKDEGSLDVRGDSVVLFVALLTSLPLLLSPPLLFKRSLTQLALTSRQSTFVTQPSPV